MLYYSNNKNETVGILQIMLYTYHIRSFVHNFAVVLFQLDYGSVRVFSLTLLG